MVLPWNTWIFIAWSCNMVKDSCLESFLIPDQKLLEDYLWHLLGSSQHQFSVENSLSEKLGPDISQLLHLVEDRVILHGDSAFLFDFSNDAVCHDEANSHLFDDEFEMGVLAEWQEVLGPVASFTGQLESWFFFFLLPLVVDMGSAGFFLFQHRELIWKFVISICWERVVSVGV